MNRYVTSTVTSTSSIRRFTSSAIATGHLLYAIAAFQFHAPCAARGRRWRHRRASACVLTAGGTCRGCAAARTHAFSMPQYSHVSCSFFSASFFPSFAAPAQEEASPMTRPRRGKRLLQQGSRGAHLARMSAARRGIPLCQLVTSPWGSQSTLRQ